MSLATWPTLLTFWYYHILNYFVNKSANFYWNIKILYNFQLYLRMFQRLRNEQKTTRTSFWNPLYDIWHIIMIYDTLCMIYDISMVRSKVRQHFQVSNVKKVFFCGGQYEKSMQLCIKTKDVPFISRNIVPRKFKF